jgi:hypothetical protein
MEPRTALSWLDGAEEQVEQVSSTNIGIEHGAQGAENQGEQEGTEEQAQQVSMTDDVNIGKGAGKSSAKDFSNGTDRISGAANAGNGEGAGQVMGRVPQTPRTGKGSGIEPAANGKGAGKFMGRVPAGPPPPTPRVLTMRGPLFLGPEIVAGQRLEFQMMVSRGEEPQQIRMVQLLVLADRSRSRSRSRSGSSSLGSMGVDDTP